MLRKEKNPKIELEEPSTTDIPITNGTYSMRSKTALLWRALGLQTHGNLRRFWWSHQEGKQW
jgi:hypothetical protein